MKAKISIWIISVIHFLLITGSKAQNYRSEGIKTDDAISNQCVYDLYKKPLEDYYLLMQEKNYNRMKSRDNNGNFELRIYVDTSYERLRTGGYDNNAVVLLYLNNLINNVDSMFDSAAPNWDVDMEPEILFFDGQTPFAYGSNISQTLINFYTWVDTSNYPGNEDIYIFYTGNYSNQGVSFLSSLCAPGGALLGFISNQNSDVDLGSHEWVGHGAASNHYNGEVNIMNSVSKRPWNAPSLDVIENFLENQTCVANTQAPLSYGIESFHIELQNQSVVLDWAINNDLEISKFIIERKTDFSQWIQINSIQTNKSNKYSFYDHLTNSGNYYYRVIGLSAKSEIVSDIQTVHYNKEGAFTIDGYLISNEEKITFFVFDAMGRLILKTDIAQFDLRNIHGTGPYFIRAGKMSKLVLL